MIKSLKLGAQAMDAQMTRNDVIANNLANVSTSGFKREVARFVAADAQTANEVSQLSVTSDTDFSQGFVRPTGNNLDVVVEGEGFFVVDTPDGERYTRAGEFNLNESGQLVTRAGFAVKGTSGAIDVDTTLGLPEIAGDGTISVGGVAQGQIKVVKFEDSQTLTRLANNMFAAAGQAPEDVPEGEKRILSGFVEGSNVNAVKEMIAMISALRAYQAMEKSIQSADQILDTVINRVGRAPTG